MNQRERFLAVFNYQPVDRCPIWDFGFWTETLARWRGEQGLPADANPDDFFGMDRQWVYSGLITALLPHFPYTVLEDQGEIQITLGGDGVIARGPKDQTSMPDFIGYTLKDRATWEEHYKWRLDPDMPGHIPPEFIQNCYDVWPDSKRDFPILVHCGSVFGDLRNWLGLENFSYIQVDDPPLFREMVETIGNCIAVTLDRALATAQKAGVTFDMGHFWEDICYNHGPLINPPTFVEIGIPQIKRITDICRKYGVPFFSVDCDGKVDELILPWRGRRLDHVPHRDRRLGRPIGTSPALRQGTDHDGRRRQADHGPQPQGNRRHDRPPHAAGGGGRLPADARPSRAAGRFARQLHLLP